MLFLKNVKAKGSTDKSFQKQTYKVLAIFMLVSGILTYLSYTFIMGFMMSLIVSSVIGLVTALYSARFIYDIEGDEIQESENPNDLRKVWDVDLDSSSKDVVEYLDGNSSIIIRITHGSSLPSDSANNEKFYMEMYNYLYSTGLVINTTVMHQEVSYQPFDHVNRNLGECKYQSFHELMSFEILHAIEYTTREIRVPVEYITVRTRIPKQRTILRNIHKELLEIKRINSATLRSVEQLNRDEAILYFKQYLGLEVLDTSTFTIKSETNVQGVHVYGYLDNFNEFHVVEDIVTSVRIKNLKKLSEYREEVGEDLLDATSTPDKEKEEWVIGI